MTPYFYKEKGRGGRVNMAVGPSAPSACAPAKRPTRGAHFGSQEQTEVTQTHKSIHLRNFAMMGFHFSKPNHRE
jgi:hypothetical protein